MKHFPSVLFGATLAATTAVVAFAPSSAQAIQLSGSVSINGTLDITQINSTTVGLDFVDVDGVSSTPVFSNFLPPLNTGSLTIKDLTLTALVTPTLTANYATGAVATFLDFGTRTLGSDTGLLTFDLNAANFLVTTIPSTGSIAATLQGATGVWKFNGSTIATGAITGTDFGEGSYTISLTAQPVPEPITMGGLALGAGFGAFLKSRYSKKDEQVEKV
jgi:hypothetical protein